MRPLDDLEIREAGDGCALRLRVRPGARRDEVTGVHGGALKVSVKAPPERGRANEAVEALLARGLGIPRGDVAITAGGASRDKACRVRGLAPEELRRRLSAAWSILDRDQGTQGGSSI